MTTKEEIQKSINSRLVTPPTQMEGGTIQDIVGSVSYELANIVDTRINVVLDNAFVLTADEEHLLMRGNEFGISKKQALSALVIAKITNAQPNFLITTEIKAKTKSGLIFRVMENTYTNEDGIALVKMECLEQGSIGNIEPNELNAFYASYQGLEMAKITNEASGTNGYDEETTEEYRQRILEFMRNNSCNSNIKDYEKWAKSVPGVKNVVVKDAFTAGSGKVKVYISASDNQTISDELIQSVKTKIEKEQIINAKVEVVPLQYFEINVSANVVLKENASLQAVKDEFKKLLDDYLKTNPSMISYLFISNLLFEVDGILDVSNYLVNNSNQTIQIQELQIPISGEITVLEVQNDA